MMPARDIARLIAGTGLAQAINAISIPILAWIYDPAVLGLFLVIDAYCDVLALGSPLAMDKALHVSTSARRDRALLSVASASVLGVATLGALGSFVGIASGNGDAWIACAVFALIILRGAFYVQQSVLMKARDFGRIGRAEIVRSGSNMVGRIGFGLLDFGVAGLVASAIGSGLIALRAMRTPLALPDMKHWRYALRLVSRYRHFLLWEGCAQFLRQMPLRASVIVVAAIFALEQAAFFALALLLIFRPAEVAVRAVAEVSRASIGFQIRLRKDDTRLAKNAVLTVWLFAPPATIAIAGLVVQSEGLLLPDQWQGLGGMCIALCPFGIALMTARPLQALFSVLQRQRTGFMLDFGLAACAVVGLLLCGQGGLDIETSSALTGFAMLTVSAGFTALMVGYAQPSDRNTDGRLEI